MNNLFSIRRKNDNPSGAIIWSQEQINFIIQEYQKHHSTTIIAKQFNVCPQSIRTILRKNNVNVLSIQELNKLNFPRDSDFFEIINTPEKAYWLGFLYADGYISKTNEIRINLKQEDKDHLIKFCKVIQAPKTSIKYSEKREKDKIYYQAYIGIRDIKMANDLADKGCINNKSLVLTFPLDKIPELLYSHFIRGYMDGDGSIHYTQSGRAKTPNYRLSFIGTKNMLTSIKHILGKNNLSLENRTTHYSLQISGNKQLEKIFEYIYKDSYDGIELTRKRQIYNNFLLQRLGGEPIDIGCE